MNVSESAVRRPITTVMVALSVIVLGWISLFRLPLEYMPNLTWPAMYISVNYPSSSPEEVERNISRPIEDVMGTLSSIKSLSSSSYAHRSSVRIEFDLDTDMDLVAVQIRDRLDQVRNDLPNDVERVEIRRWNTEDWPILDYSVAWAGADQDELVQLWKHTLYPRLQRIEGVGNIEIEGLDERALLVDVDQNLLNTHGLDIRSLNTAIRTNNTNVSAGYVMDGGKRLAVRTIGEFERVDQIRTLPIRDDIQMSDVADVSYDYPEKKSFERLDGTNAVSIEVRKASTANLVAVADRVKAEVAKIRSEVGPNLKMSLTRDASLDVTSGITNLAKSAAMGGMLAIGVIFVFLRNFRSTVIIGAAIPVSVLCVFMIMYLMRQFTGATITLNLISMMGLMVAIGMLVDPAVVALENIFRKRFENGESPVDAAISGAREIGLPVVAASFTTICVFVPMVFITDSRSSLFMRDFALTVVISVVASLLVALTLVPLAASRAFSEGGRRAEIALKAGLILAFGGLAALLVKQTGTVESIAWLRGGFGWFVSGLSTLPPGTWAGVAVVLAIPVFLILRYRLVGLRGAYVGIINSTLNYRWTTVAAACVLLGVGFHVYGKIEKSPYRWQPTRRVTFSVELPRNYDVHDARALFQRCEDALVPLKEELDIEAIKTRFSNRRSNRLTIYLKSADESDLTTDEVKKKVAALLPKDIPGVRFKTGRSWGSTATGAGVELKGRDPQVLAMLARDIALRMQDLQGVHDVETSLESGTEEIRVTVNRERAQRMGLTPRNIATTIASALGSRGNSKFKTDDGEIDIAVQLKEEDRATLAQLMNAQFESARGELVSFASLADFEYSKGPNTIRRDDRKSTISIFANTEESGRFRVGMQMMRRMEAVPLPNGYTWQMDRRFRRMQQEQSEGDFTMVFAAILIYIIMASLFESFIHPFTIMFSIGFAFVGVAFGLYTFNIPMDSNASYGLLILFGIVVNNGIVFVDHINRYRREGYARREAITRGGQDRLRPILMTATTTILGLAPLVVPMIYGTAEGTARRWGPIGLVVVCGLFASTVLTLVLLPTVYSLMDDLSAWAKRVVVSSRFARAS